MGYKSAISLAEAKLQTLCAETVTQRTGTRWEKGVYSLPWFGEWRSLASGSEVERVLWLHYLTSEGTGLPSGKWIAYRDLSGAGFYEPKFNQRAVRPLAKRFGREPEALLRAGEALGGVRAPEGDFAVVLYPLPRLPVLYMLWAGDDEVPAEANVLFDRTASGWLAAEDLTVLASLGTYRLIA